jgi:hypothetical protein
MPTLPHNGKFKDVNRLRRQFTAMQARPNAFGRGQLGQIKNSGYGTAQQPQRLTG